jgi:hypothetical protein
MGVAGNEEGVHADVDGRMVVLLLVALLLVVVVGVVGVCGCAGTAVVQRRSLHGLLYKGWG